MNYVASGKKINIGDIIVADGMQGTVVCDYDNNEALEGFEGWLIKEELVGGGYLNSGIMINTNEAGLIYYSEEDEGIIFVSHEK